MNDVAELTPVTDALLVALKTIGRPIGDGEKPPSPNPPPDIFYPYAILYAGTQALEGSYVRPHEDGLHRAQVTSIGKTRDAVDQMRDHVRSVVLAGDLDIDGYALVWAQLIDGQPTGRDDDAKPPVFYGVDVFHLFVTPLDSGS